MLAVAIETNSARAHIDWRTDYDSLQYQPIEVPADIGTGLLAYLRALGLHYGAFDFVITPQGEWVMLECNLPANGCGCITSPIYPSPPQWLSC